MIQWPRTAARALITGNASVAVAVTDSSMIWLQNSTSDPIEVGPCELFGYNMGSFSAKKIGRSSLDCYVVRVQRIIKFVILQFCCFLVF